MTEDDQRPFDGPSDEHQNHAPDAADESAKVGIALIANDSRDQTDESVEFDAPGSEEPIAERSDAPLTPKQHDVAQLAGSATGPTETSEPSAPGTEVSRPAVPEQRLYFLTNRMNLNGILSSRLVAPRESFHKYYMDLLEQTRGWVPLLRDAPPLALVEAVTRERGAGAPVLVEFPIDILAKVKSDSAVVYVPAVALSEAVAIHLPSVRDLREHRARGYNNIHPHDQLLRVTPELFQSGASYVLTPCPSRPAPTVNWRSIDRIRGAINAAFASVNSGEQLVIAAALIGATQLPAAVNVPAWSGWLDIDDHSVPDARPEPDSTRPDRVLFRAAYDVLGDEDVSEAWIPNEVLKAVESRVRETGLANEATDAIVRNLDRVRSIVNVEVDFESFRPSSRGLVSAKALLLVLLRQELDQLLAWSGDETGADDATRVAAAVLAGRLRGLARESTELRSLALDDLTAAWAVRVAGGGSSMLGRAQILSSRRGTSLKIGGIEVAVQCALVPDLLSKYQKTAEDKREALRIKVSRAMGWPVEHRIQIPAGATVTTNGALITIASPDEVVLDIASDESVFVRNLESLRGVERRRAAEAFEARP